ncbi:MAG: DUF2164 family protein, partial [Acidobacteriota bacterium]
MPIKLPKKAEKRCVESIQAFFDEHMDTSIGDLKARLVLDFCLERNLQKSANGMIQHKLASR